MPTRSSTPTTRRRWRPWPPAPRLHAGQGGAVARHRDDGAGAACHPDRGPRHPGRAGGDDPAAAVGDGHRPGAGRALGRPHARGHRPRPAGGQVVPDPAGGRAGVGRPGPAGGGRRPPQARSPWAPPSWPPGRRGRWRPTPPPTTAPAATRPAPPAAAPGAAAGAPIAATLWPHRRPRRPPGPRLPPGPRQPPAPPQAGPPRRAGPSLGARAAAGAAHRCGAAQPGSPAGRQPLRRRPAPTRASSPREPHLRGGPVRATAALAGLPGGRDAPAPARRATCRPATCTDARATRKKKERRKLMISLGVVLVVAAVAATLIIQDLQSQPETVASLEVGECFTGEATDLSTVDCGQPHNGELYFLAAPRPRRGLPRRRGPPERGRPGHHHGPGRLLRGRRRGRRGAEHRGPAAGALGGPVGRRDDRRPLRGRPRRGRHGVRLDQGRGAARPPEEHRGHVVDVGVDERARSSPPPAAPARCPRPAGPPSSPSRRRAQRRWRRCQTSWRAPGRRPWACRPAARGRARWPGSRL